MQKDIVIKVASRCVTQWDPLTMITWYVSGVGTTAKEAGAEDRETLYLVLMK